MHRVNAGGTRVLARACAALPNPPVLLYLSSVAAAGPTAIGRLRVESDPASPVSAYGRSKRAGELAVADVAERLPGTIVRPGVVFGPHSREMLPLFQNIQWTRIHLVPSLSPPPLSLIHVDDLVALMIRAAERGRRLPSRSADFAATGEGSYFACIDEFPDFGQLGRAIAASLGQPHIVVMPCIEPVAWTFAGCAQFASLVTRRSLTLNVDKMREALAESWACSNQAARHDLQFDPAFDLSNGLRDTTAWYREQGWL
jgi:nucleoside-diphosphate-sugar epimerase